MRPLPLDASRSPVPEATHLARRQGHEDADGDDEMLMDGAGTGTRRGTDTRVTRRRSLDGPSSITVQHTEDGHPRYVLDSYARPTTPSDFFSSEATPTISDFSLTTTMDGRVFREDEGRLYQAQNDDYTLPADEEEMERLEHQHYGLKATQGGRNYITPFDRVLVNGGEGKRGLDVGCGTGAWVIEMAREFDKAEWVGTDLAPVQRDHNLPDNIHFVHEDISRGLPYPDEYFDVIHARIIYMGIRDWRYIVREATRLLRPGGMMVFVEVDGRWRCHGMSREDSMIHAPGYQKFCDYFEVATINRGLDVDAARYTIKHAIAERRELTGFSQIETFLPFSPWSDDPDMKHAGERMIPDSAAIPGAIRQVMLEAGNLTTSKLDELCAGYHRDVGDYTKRTGVYVYHNVAFKVSGESASTGEQPPIL